MFFFNFRLSGKMMGIIQDYNTLQENKIKIIISMNNKQRKVFIRYLTSCQFLIVVIGVKGDVVPSLPFTFELLSEFVINVELSLLSESAITVKDTLNKNVITNTKNILANFNILISGFKISLIDFMPVFN